MGLSLMKQSKTGSLWHKHLGHVSKGQEPLAGTVSDITHPRLCSRNWACYLCYLGSNVSFRRWACQLCHMGYNVNVEHFPHIKEAALDDVITHSRKGCDLPEQWQKQSHSKSCCIASSETWLRVHIRVLYGRSKTNFQRSI